MIKKTILAAALVLSLPLVAHGNIGVLGILPALTGSYGPPGIGGQNDIAYNDKQGVYLQVWGHPAVWGRFVDANGVALGSGPFLIAATGTSDGLPRVTYSTGGADDVFLVRMASEVGQGRYLYIRLVRYTPAGPELGPLQHVSGVGGEGIFSGGIAFNPAKRQFFLTWESSIGGWDVYGQLWQMLGTPGASISPDVVAMGPATPIHNLSEMGNAQGCPNTAYDWKHDSYFVVWCGETVVSDRIFGAWGRQIRFDQNNAISKGAIAELTAGNGRPLEPGVAYMPEADGFLTFWTDVTSVRDLSGRLVDHFGGIQSGIFPILATSSNEGAADAEYSPYTRSIFVAAMRDATKYIQGIEVSAHGAVQSFFQASTAIPSGPNESFYPAIGVGHDGRFALSYVNGFSLVYTEMLAGPVVAGGHFVPGWTGSGTPPPPAPTPCTITFSTDGATFSALGGGGGFTLTTASTCSWSAASNVPWISLSSSSRSGTGTTVLSYTVAPNDTNQARTGLISSGNRSLTITQAGRAIRVADFNRDGRNDIVWHNRSTGALSVWRMNGLNLIEGVYLSPAAVPDTNWRVVGTMDADRNGHTDLLWQHDTGLVAVWRMSGETMVAGDVLSVSAQADPRWRIVATGDLDGDGWDDILWQHETGPVAVWYMNGLTQRSGQVLTNLTDSRWRVVGAGDFNQDGRLDLLWHHSASGQVAIWLMNNQRLIDGILLNQDVADLRWQIEGVSDFNGDGRPDVLWRNTQTGQVAAWIMNGASYAGTDLLAAVPDVNWRIVGPR
jgi:hypothetical protein